jgi:cytochrome c biogenesis protein ResB
MNVKLQYDLEFMAGVYFENQLHMNSYSVNLQLLTLTNDVASTNIAMERLKCFVYYDLGDTLFINQAEKEKAEMLQILGANITTLPDDPVDQIIGIMLVTKLNAIMEGRMMVTRLDISSIMGDSVWYQHEEEDPMGPFVEDGWWHRPGTQHNNIDLETVSEKIVKVNPHAWSEYGLVWPEEQIENAGNTVVFANFQKNENQ